MEAAAAGRRGPGQLVKDNRRVIKRWGWGGSSGRDLIVGR